MRELDELTFAACRRGDPRAFRRLVEAFQGPVVALCRALAGADGEDLAQDTFVRVHAALPAFDPSGPASLRGWILTIARRLCTDRARHTGRGIEVMIPPPDLADEAPRPDEQIEQARLRARVWRALATLPPDQRAVLALFEWEGLPYEEIAAIEDVPVGTVRSRLARARAALKTALATPAGAHAKEVAHGSH